MKKKDCWRFFFKRRMISSFALLLRLTDRIGSVQEQQQISLSMHFQVWKYSSKVRAEKERQFRYLRIYPYLCSNSLT